LVNVDEVKEYMKRAGVMTYTPTAKPVGKLADLKAAELTDAQVEDIVTKAEMSELTVTEVTQ
jgi:Tfp pilus assembly major pilin PilA